MVLKHMVSASMFFSLSLMMAVLPVPTSYRSQLQIVGQPSYYSMQPAAAACLKLEARLMLAGQVVACKDTLQLTI